MHPLEVEFIKSFLKPDHTMLEWGSGGSTLFFSKLVKEYHSIEHDKTWHGDIQKNIEKESLDNVSYHFVPPSEAWERPKGWRDIPNYRTPVSIFKDYIEVVDKIDKEFDVVLVDGRCRSHCAAKALPYLKDDGILLFHDFYPRKKFGYHDVLCFYENTNGLQDTPQTIASFSKKFQYMGDDTIRTIEEITKAYEEYNNEV